MLSLFDSPPPIAGGVLRFPQWNYVRDGMRRNVATAVQYYQSNPTAVASQNFLVRLLHSITVPQTLPTERYFDNVDAIALNTSMALKMTSAIYKGQVFNGEFYGQGSQEILIAHDEWFDPESAHRHWTRLQPIRVLRSPHTNLGYNIPDGKRSGSETGVSVIAINVTMLCMQYRAFRMVEQRIAEENGGDSQRSIYQFLRMYPLTNMLISQTDLVVFNRLHARLVGAPIGESSRRHSFYLPDYSLKLNEVQDRILQGLEKSGRNFYDTMRTVPLVFNETLADQMLWPDVAPTRQVVWGMVMGRIPLMDFLFKSAKGGPRIRNKAEYNQLVRQVRAYRSESLFKSMLSGDLLEDTLDELHELLNY